MTNHPIGAEVARRRSALRLSLAGLADLSGVKRSTIYSVERAAPGATITVAVLEKLARAFGVSVGTLINPRPSRRRSA